MIPLVLDLDGTIVPGDTLIECALRLLAGWPGRWARALPLAFSDRAAFKRRLAEAAGLDPRTLAYNPAVLDLARAARAEGRPVFMATAADAGIAERVSAHLGLFDGVMASDGQVNLKGEAKAAALAARFGAGNFDYVGDAAADLPVWAQARRAILVAPSAALRARAAALCRDVQVVGVRPGWMARAKILARAVRVHQWAKNLLVFVPVLAAHKAHGLADGGLAFLAFGLCASSVYLLNDLLDLPHDRAHATKRRRPFASGDLSLSVAPALIGGFLAGAGVACLFLPAPFLAMLAIYYASTLAYSFVLKRRAVWDVVALAGLYTMRIFAGAAATSTPISPWMLAFSLFLFFCLAIVKRLTELVRAEGRGLSGRGYEAGDLDMLRSMAASSGTAAVMVLALYINSAEVVPLYRHPSYLWALCPLLLFWVSRILMLSNRGVLDEDPVVFALRDRGSLLAGAVCLAAILAAA